MVLGCAGLAWIVATTEMPPEEQTAAAVVESTEVIDVFEAATDTPTEGIAAGEPTDAPTSTPTEIPTDVPPDEPTVTPTTKPTEEPTETPTDDPAETPAPRGLGRKKSAISAFEGLGFRGFESPLADGTPRWLGQRARDSASVMIIGPDNAIQEISVLIVASAEAGALIAEAGALSDAFLIDYAPGSNAWFQTVLDSYKGADLDERQTFDDRSVHVMIMTANGGAMAIVTVAQE